MQEGKRLTEHLILSMCPDFVLSRTPQIPRQKYTSEHLFYRTASSGFCQISVIFLKKEKNRNSFLYLLCAWYAWNLVIASKSLKSFSFIILKKTTPIYLQYPSNFVIQNTKTTLLAFHVMLTFSFKLVDAIDNKRVNQAWKQIQ